MEASRTRPEPTMPPSPVDSLESLASSSSSSSSSAGSPVTDDISDLERPRNVMITLSLTPDPPTSAPSRPPFPRSHLRSRSLADTSGLPIMIRAHSSPGLDSRGRYIYVNGRGVPTNMPEGSPKRYLPLQLPTTEYFETRLTQRNNVSETISEHAELDTSGPSTTHSEFPSASPVLSHSVPRVGRRQTSSPLHFPQTPSREVHSSPSSAHSSPNILSSRYNEAFPAYSASSASSMPSTPTSLRSRSPSISSLETIPDIPDAEAAAIESDRIAALKAAADRADDADASSGSRRRGASDMSGPSSGLNMRTGGTAGYRKRWSVCGAERRQDLDLETIWED
ncbi:hypothetical protein BJX70DRAFT_378604 [Aspergillus crustosus]